MHGVDAMTDVRYSDDELLEIYNERVAVRELDGGLSKPRAEQQAYFDFRAIVGGGFSVPPEIRRRAAKFRGPARCLELGCSVKSCVLKRQLNDEVASTRFIHERSGCNAAG